MNRAAASSGMSRLLSDSICMSALASDRSLLSASSTYWSSSSDRSPSRTSRISGRAISSLKVRSPLRPRYRLSTAAASPPSQTPRMSCITTCHARGRRPSGLVRPFSMRSTCCCASICRARMRSSAALRRLTLPISRRYIRTGSSITSVDSMPCCQARSASLSASASSWTLFSAVPSASWGVRPAPESSDICGEPSPPGNRISSRAGVESLGRPLSRSFVSSLLDRLGIGAQPRPCGAAGLGPPVTWKKAPSVGY